MYCFDTRKRKIRTIARYFSFSWRDLGLSVFVFLCATCLCGIVQKVGVTEGFSFPVFLLAVLIVARLTSGYLFGILTAVAGVICVNYIFTFPYWELNFTISGYPLTFLTFLTVSVTTSALVTQVQEQERVRAMAEKEKMRADLLRSVSHDIRTPLTSIIGATSTVLDNPDLPAETRGELLGDVREEARWLIRVVENLLSITRISGDQTHILTDFEVVEEVAGEAVRKFRRRFPEISISIDAPEEVLLAPMDAILIEQVLSNLMENSVLHGKGTTQIQLMIQKKGNTVEFAVRDNGRGFSPDRLDALLLGEKYQKKRESIGDGKRNMGIGLSVCRAIIHAHGGIIQMGNLKDGGAEVMFSLPMEEGEKIYEYP